MGRDLPQVPVKKGSRASRARACIYVISCSNAAGPDETVYYFFVSPTFLPCHRAFLLT